VASTCPNPFSLFGGIGYDSASASVICNDSYRTWRWNGSVWSIVEATSWYLRHIVTHTRRGTAIAFGGPTGPWTDNDLYEWNGTTWVLVPTTNRPPRPFVSYDHFVDYLTCAYDERRDKVVLVGTGLSDLYGNITSPQPVVWEWDEANQWVQRSVTSTPTFSYGVLFFESQRGVITAIIQGGAGQLQMFEWDGANAWHQIIPVAMPPANLGVERFLVQDSTEGITFATCADSLSATGYAYRTVSPATFAVTGAGCTGSLGEPTLCLTHNWTRAWLGGILSVNLTNLPQSAGFVVNGWSATSAGAFALPLSLDPFGMPGCMARVSFEDVRFVSGSNNAATTTMPVPLSNALLGLSFYQQGYAVDPAANAASLVAGNAVRITVGRL
jgi:hypothetical protein